MAPKTTIILGADGVLTDEAGETRVSLTPREATIALALSGRRGSVLTKNALMTELYQGHDEPEVKIVDVFICKVRAKLAKVGGEGAIETVWGRGYRWNGDFRLALPDSNHVSMEVTPELGRRLEDLALATDQTVSQVLLAMVTEKIDEHERRAWEW